MGQSTLALTRIMLPPTSRTAPCPCGSGRRFKDCHGALDAGTPAVDAETLFEQANLAFDAGRFAQAEALLRTLLEHAPASVAAWNLLGEALLATAPAAAPAAWWQALAIDPDDAEASFHLGNRNREQGEQGAAIIHYERALRRAPGHAGLLNNLGLSYKATGEAERAEACFRDALAIEPEHADALLNLCNSLFQRQHYAQAAATADRLLALSNDVAPSLRLLRALAHERLGDSATAEAGLRQAAAAAPDDATIHAYLGTLLLRLQRHREAESVLRRSLELAPQSAYALSMLAHSLQHQCAWQGLSELFARLEKLLAEDDGEGAVPVDAFSALSMPLSPQAQLHVAQRWASKFVPPRPIARPIVRIAPGERLRVAFVTANFRDHPTLHLSLEFWERIDRSRLEMFAYSLGRDDGNAYLRRAQAAFEHFVDVSALSVEAIAQRIRDDRIAIVIDRNGYTQYAREGIFALRPAPVQINCIGFPGTLGAPWYDYIFTDRFSLPEALTPFYSERPLYMPHMAFPSDTTRLPRAAPPSRADCGLPATGFVFCCFNSAYKILPDVFAVWMRLLAAVPHSVLWLLETSAEAQANLRREAQAAGIAPARLIFAPRLNVKAHLARHAVADLFLDTYPYGAHTTANDALLAGLPLLTCAGDTLVSRIAGSQLTAIGLPELITTGLADYETLALKLATDPSLLQHYRQRLESNRSTSPLFDMPRYARDFEDAMLRALVGPAGEESPGAMGTKAGFTAAALREKARLEWKLGESAAVTTCRAAIERAPEDLNAWNLLAEMLLGTDPAAASQAWWHVLSLDPDNAEASFHLGNRAREQGEHDAAIIHYERALRRAPGHAAVLNNLGLALQATGQTQRAERCYRDILAADPRHADALANLANVLFAHGALEETVQVYDRLLALPHTLPAALWVQRAIAQDAQDDAPGAAASFAEARRLAPDNLKVQVDCSSFYVRHGRFADAEGPLQRALELDPGNGYALSLLAHARQQRGLWSGLDALTERIGRLLQGEERRGDYPVAPFYVLSLPLPIDCQLRAAQRWARALPVSAAPPPEMRQGERLRVAFVTANFRDHPTLHLSLEFWERIDRSRLEMFAYSLGRDDGNAYLRRAQAAFEHFVDVSALSVEAIAQRIRDDRIAIVIDRNGYTQYAREGIFALRPAPVQINCIGFPGTLGAPWYDYIFTDRFSLPEALTPFYSERPLYMPHMAFPSDTTRLPRAAPPSRADCGLPATGFVFCCFNSAYKILPDVFAVWMRLLAAVPHSVLWLLETSAEAQANLRREAQAAGIAPARLIFAPRLNVKAHLARHAVADLFLDTYPYGAHTTANDALLAGLPLLTCAGDTLVSRIAGSQLTAIGLPELITTGLADYETLALKLATDPSLLQHYRQRLESNRSTSPLFDMPRYARDFEDAMLRARAR